MVVLHHWMLFRPELDTRQLVGITWTDKQHGISSGAARRKKRKPLKDAGSPCLLYFRALGYPRQFFFPRHPRAPTGKVCQYYYVWFFFFFGYKIFVIRHKNRRLFFYIFYDRNAVRHGKSGFSLLIQESLILPPSPMHSQNCRFLYMPRWEIK